MIIIGIDPGTTRAGYGVISAKGSNLQLITAGVLQVKRSDSKADVLEDIRAEVALLCDSHKPNLLAVEKLYFSNNQKTAFAVAEARGAILLASKMAGVKIREYSPTEAKASLTGNGRADKKAVLKMVRLILRQPGLKVIDDASDALALAIVAAQDLRTKLQAGQGS